MWSSSDVMRFLGTRLQQSEASVCLVLSVYSDGADVQLTDASVVTIATSNLITVDNRAIPALLM